MSRRPKPTPIPTVQSLDMTASRWRCVTDYSSCVGCPPSPAPAQPYGAAWSLMLPRLEDGAANKIGYVLCPHTAPITSATLEGAFTLNATVGTQFADAKAPSDGSTPASFRFIIMAGLDGISMEDPHKRYWSNPVAAVLQHGGPWFLSVPLTSNAWSSVYGERDAAKFAALLRAPQFIGPTFGAGGDFGHSIVTVGGYATLTAQNLRLL